MKRSILALFLFLAWPVLLQAGQADTDAGRQKLAEKFDVSAEDITSTPLAGVYEIRVGGQVAYVSADGRYLLQGDLIDLRQQRNLTEERRSEVRLALLASVAADQMIVFPARQTRHTITVFTDIDCGYCRRLHQEINELNARGVTVHYLFYPRAGAGSSSWQKAREVWCAKDRNSALTRAKQGQPVSSPECPADPVTTHYHLGQMVGVSGTPAIITDTGEMIRGYMPVDQLVQVLDKQNPAD